MSAYWTDKTRDGHRIHHDDRGLIYDEIDCYAGALHLIEELEAEDAACAEAERLETQQAEADYEAVELREAA